MRTTRGRTRLVRTLAAVAVAVAADSAMAMPLPTALASRDLEARGTSSRNRASRLWCGMYVAFFSLLSASLTDYDGRALVTVVDGQRGSCGVV
jgi:hypothetical protein